MYINKYLTIGLTVFIALGNGESLHELYSGTPCTRKLLNGLPGICKLAETCQWLTKQLRSKLISRQDLNTLRCGFDGNDEITCCADPVSNPTIRKSEIACKKYRNHREPPITYHIVNGNLSALGEFPHMVALGYLSEENKQIDFKCGGSLISERYILTAAHCSGNTRQLKPIVARLGTINVKNPETDPENYGDVVDINIERVIVHPDYKSFRSYHDIALVHLSKDVIFNGDLHPACLNAELSDISPSSGLIISGWGKVNGSSDWRSPLLLKTNLTGVTLTECNVSLSEWFGKKLSLGLSIGHLCAHDPKGKSDACQGDSGGPLQIFDNLTDTRFMPILLGVTSFGVACGTILPSVYTRVAFYLDWIESYVWPN